MKETIILITSINIFYISAICTSTIFGFRENKKHTFLSRNFDDNLSLEFPTFFLKKVCLSRYKSQPGKKKKILCVLGNFAFLVLKVCI